VAEERQTAKPAGAKERVSAAARSVTGAKAFFTILIALLAIILIVQNWAPVPLSIFGVTFHLPGTLCYVLLFACGMLVGIWLEGRRRT